MTFVKLMHNYHHIKCIITNQNKNVVYEYIQGYEASLHISSECDTINYIDISDKVIKFKNVHRVKRFGSLMSLFFKKCGTCDRLDCSICLEKFNGEDDIIKLPCNDHHVFHSRCMENLLNQHGTKK